MVNGLFSKAGVVDWSPCPHSITDAELNMPVMEVILVLCLGLGVESVTVGLLSAFFRARQSVSVGGVAVSLGSV